MLGHVVRSRESSTFFLLLFIAFTRVIALLFASYAAILIARIKGASDYEIGFINGFYVLAYACSAMFFGTHSDKWGRKRVLLLSHIVAAAISINYIFLILFAGELHIPTILTFIGFLRILDGVFLGAFWAPLQGRLCESPEWSDGRLRYYNLSWSLGILFANVIMSAATGVVPLPDTLFPVLAMLLIISEGIFSLNIVLMLLKLQDLPKNCPSSESEIENQVNSQTGTKKKHQSKKLSPQTKIAIFAMVIFGMLMGTLYTSIFNQFSRVSIETLGIVNLIPWVALLDNVRFSTQTVTLAIAKKPLHPKQRFLVLSGISILILIGLAFASEFLLQTGIISFIPLVGIGGIMLGLFFANGFSVIASEARPDNQGYYQGILETISNVGYFVGVVISGSISDFFGYFASYTVVASCMLGFFILIALNPVPNTSEIKKIENQVN
ncbi:MAG: major facilitator superfamily protein [Promethearchaeota archaeon CR_4]|nr:MAG: major facilitator superfamily protein [Candidatus Lokiarchaeota archaeon CR_4]